MKNHRIDPDDSPGGVRQNSAGVSRREAHIRLNPFLRRRTERTNGVDHSHRDCGVIPSGCPMQQQSGRPQPIRIADLRRLQTVRYDSFQQRQVPLAVPLR